MLSGSRFNSSVCPFYKLFYQSFLFLNQFPLLLSKFSLIHFSNLSLYQILPIILHFPKSLKFFFVFLPPSVSKFFTLLLIWTLHRVLIVHFRYWPQQTQVNFILKRLILLQKFWIESVWNWLRTPWNFDTYTNFSPHENYLS